MSSDFHHRMMLIEREEGTLFEGRKGETSNESEFCEVTVLFDTTKNDFSTFVESMSSMSIFSEQFDPEKQFRLIEEARKNDSGSQKLPKLNFSSIALCRRCSQS